MNSFRTSISTQQAPVQEGNLKNLDTDGGSAKTEAQPKHVTDIQDAEMAITSNVMTAEATHYLSPTFTLFPKLAIELRLMIWNFSLPGPQIIMISSHGCGLVMGGCSSCRFLRLCEDNFADGRLPASFSLAIYHTSHEARQVALRDRPFVSFSGILHLPPYVNVAQDTLFFEDELILCLIQRWSDLASDDDKQILQRFKHIMVGKGPYVSKFGPNTVKFFQTTLSLRNLSIVARNHNIGSSLQRKVEEHMAQFKASLENSWRGHGLQEFPTVTLNVLEPVTHTQMVVRGMPLAAVPRIDETLIY